MEKRFLLVGGAVRDKLLGKEPKDRDWLAEGWTEDELLAAGFKRVGKDFPVFLHPETGDEVALPRKEKSIGNGHRDFSFIVDGVTVEEDLSRRDLTINAMAMDEAGEIIDPFGGIDDLKKGILRHVTEAFQDDPLRVLRVARFAAQLGFTVAPETVELCRGMKGSLGSLTKERVWGELEKALRAPRPERFFLVLKEFGVIDTVFPFLSAWIETEHDNPHHLEGSVFNHAVLVLAAAARITSDPVTRFAAFFHDLAKPASMEKFGNFHSHTKKELVEAELEKIKEHLKTPKIFFRAAKQAALFHHKIHSFDELRAATVAKTFADGQFPKNREELDRLLLVAAADEIGRLKERRLDLNEAVDVVVKRTSSAKVNPDVQRAFDAFKSVSLKGVDLSGMNTERIKQTLHQMRVSAIKKGKEVTIK